MIIHNEDVKELVSEIPEGHTHIRTTIKLQDGTNMTFQEATIANIVRAYISIKTHPLHRKTVLNSTRLNERKNGYAEWQLLEDGE
jgi:isopropylmalate/homocitrate/citramalate synthase